jgi:type III secretion protein U
MSSSEEKTESPTQHKLREARKRGAVANSKDLNGAAGFCAVMLVLWFGWGFIQERLSRVLDLAIGMTHAPDIQRALPVALLQMLLDLVLICVPLLLAGVVGSVIVGFVQTRGVFSTDQISFKFSRMNPGQAIERIFSTRQLFELFKMLLKLALLLGIVFIVIKTHLNPLISSVHSGHEKAPLVSMHGLGLLFICAALTFVVLGLVDYGHQWFEFMKEQRMSKSEVKREHKELDGDPYLRAELDGQRRAMLVDRPKPGLRNAQVLITNPTHFAVALYYEPGVVDLPVLVSKGQDDQALQLRADAKRLAIPILENPPLARSLFRLIALGDPIAEEHIEAVAEVFRWLKRVRPATAAVT